MNLIAILTVSQRILLTLLGPITTRQLQAGDNIFPFHLDLDC